MSFRPLVRSIALLLALSACVSGTAVAAQSSSWYEEKTYVDVDFSDMAFSQPYDESRLDEVLAKLTALSRQKQVTDQGRAMLYSQYHEMEQLLEELVTRSNLASLQYDHNQRDEAAAQQSAEYTAQVTQSMNDSMQVLQMVAKSVYAQELEHLIGQENMESLRYFAPMSPQELEMSQQEIALTQQYDQAMQQVYTYSYEGKEWDEAQLLAAEDLDSDSYQEIYAGIMQQKNQVAGEIFVQLVQLRTEMAQMRGYDNYADYAYAEIYARDYNIEDVQELYEQAKEYTVPVEIALSQRIRDASFPQSPGGEAILDAMQPHMGQIAPELEKSFSALRSYHLYDIEAGENKYQGGYTVELPYYHGAFIFDSPYGNIQDYSTMIHEFGHYNAAYYNTEPLLWSADNLDTAEVQSQGLEMLFLDFAGEMLGEEYADFFRDFSVYNMLYSVSDGCMYDEFQQAVYRQPDLTLEEINGLFLDISQEYGYTYDRIEQSYHWVEVPHTFHSPMYYISYATSALAALQIYQMSLEDRQEAIDAYMSISAAKSTVPFRQTLEASGLKDIFAWGTVADIARTLDQALLDGETLPSFGMEMLYLAIGLLVIVAIFLVPVALLVLVVFLLLRRRKRRQQQMQ